MKTVKYSVPTTGTYMVSKNITRMDPTDQFETIPNPDRYWFEFWKPETVERRIYISTEVAGGFEHRYLRENEIVELIVPAYGPVAIKLGN